MKIEGEDEPEDALPEPHPLLQLTADLVEKRYARLRAKQDEYEAYLDSIAPELEDVFWEAYNKAKSSHHEAIREEFAAQRIEELQRRFKRSRDRDKPLESRSNEELQAEIEHAIAREQKGGIYQRKNENETWQEWQDRLDRLFAYVDNIGFILYVRQRETKVAYVEGFPRNVLAVHPKFMPAERARKLGINKCLQCRAKRLRCSHDVESKYVDKSEAGCSRCRRSGEKCIVKRKWDDEDCPSVYVFAWKGDAEGDGGGEELQAMVKHLWTLRTRDYRITPIKVWHHNDQPENRMNPDYEELKWKHVLKGKPTKWRFLDSGTRAVVAVKKPDDQALAVK